MYHYACQSPRGFENEVLVYRFASRAERDLYVAEHEHEGAYACSAREAASILKGDVYTRTYHQLVDGVSGQRIA